MDVIVPDVDLVVSRDTMVKAVVGAFPSTRPNDNELQDKFEFLGELGCGAFGSVFRARNRETNKIVAIKRFHDYNTWEKTGVPTSVLRECSCQKNMKHRNVVELLDVFVVSSAHYYLVFEYVESNLHQLLAVYKNDGEKFPMARVKALSRDLFTGLRFCHLQRVLHRDLKPQNLLVTAGDVLKIGDFGLAREDRGQHVMKTMHVVTLWYRAPELLMGAPDYSYPIDIWSCGCIVAEMSLGNPIFPGDSEIDTIFKMFRLLGTPSIEDFSDLASYQHWKARFPQWPSSNLSPILDQRPELGEKGVNLLQQLLMMDPKRRFGNPLFLRKQKKEHEFFAEEGSNCVTDHF